LLVTGILIHTLLFVFLVFYVENKKTGSVIVQSPNVYFLKWAMIVNELACVAARYAEMIHDLDF
jgi:hypothetical protein